MHEQWIRAWDAYNIDRIPGAIFARLHAGLVRARAKRLIVGPKQYDDHEILPHFWWAEGGNALDQNWIAGDFSTWIENRVHLRAFGVSFELSGILEILPSDSRASVARQLSVAGNENWLSTARALDYVQRSTNLDRISAKVALFEQAGFGFVAARAILAKQSQESNDTGRWAWQRREWDVPPDFWLDSSLRSHSDSNIEAGNFGVSSCIATDGKYLCVSGVHFSLDSVAEIWPSTNRASPRSGGRTPATFHDDLMCAIWKQIYENELKPRRQADIEHALLAWVENNGHKMSESAAREKAKKIWTSTKGDSL